MKIGIYDPYLDDLGGGEKYMVSLAMVLSEKHEVSLFWDNQTDIAKIAQRFSLDLKNITVKENIFIKKVDFLSRLRESAKYDMLIILSDGSIPFILSKQLLLHIQQPLHLKRLSIKTRFKLFLVSAIFYNSEYTRSFNKRLFKHITSSVLYPPVLTHASTVSKENIIIHVGRFRVMNMDNQDYKKQQVMVNNFKEMVDEGLKGWKFIVATSIHDTTDVNFQKMQESAKGYPIEFVINRSNKTLWEYYNKAKIYWHASGYGEDLAVHPEYAEHFGISTVEAMGAGVVPVVINSGGQREIITDGVNGLLWNTLEEQRMYTKKLIDNKKLLETLSKAARTRSIDFSFNKFREHVFALTYFA